MNPIKFKCFLSKQEIYQGLYILEIYLDFLRPTWALSKENLQAILTLLPHRPYPAGQFSGRL